jgi:ligand-binding sensor domain-containing protein
MKHNRNAFIILIISLMITTLACGLSGGGNQDADEPPDTQAHIEQEISTQTPADEADTAKTETEAQPVPTETEQEISGDAEQESSREQPAYQPGYEPGWRIFSNANFVNGLAFHDGVLWAATEGGVVAWDIQNDQVQKFTTLDGLGHISAYDVVVCSMPEPTVVVGTETGLSFYDIDSGTWNTTPITPKESYVTDSKVYKLFCDQQNERLLIAYHGLGVLDFASGAWQRYLSEDGLAWDSVDDMAVSGSDIWTASYKGVSVVNPQGIQVFNEATGMPEESTNTIVTDSSGTVWVGSSDGLVHFQPDGSMDQFNRDAVENFPSGKLMSMSFSPDGTLWVINSSSRVCQFDPAQSKCLYTYEGDSSSYSTDLVTGDSGDVYYSSYGGGVWAFDGGEWRNLRLQEDQLVGNFVESIAQSPDGKLWVTTDNGIQNLDPENVEAPWTSFTVGEGGPPSRWAQGVFVAPSGQVWFAHDSKRASTFDGSAWLRYGEEDGITGYINAIAFDMDEIPYFATSEGLLIMNGTSNPLLTDADGLPSKNVRSVYADGDVIWVGTVDGLARLENDSVTTVLDSTTPGLPNDNIAAIEKDSDGSLLLGTSEGLARYDGEQVVTLLVPTSVSGILGELIQAVSGIAVSPDGSLWVSSYAGVYHGNGQDWEHFTTADGLPANNVNSIFVDSSGTVWVGAGYTRSGGGIARFIPGDPQVENKESSTPAQDTSSSTPEPVDQPSASQGGQSSYDENTGLPLLADAEQVYSTEGLLNYWSSSDFVSIRQFYLDELPKIGWLLDVDENGNCRDDERCMGWAADYDDLERQTFFFLKGDKGYITLNLIPEDDQINVVFMINEPDE